MDALSTQARARAAPVRRRGDARACSPTLGPEQEYFLIDEALLLRAARPRRRPAARCSARSRRRARSSRTTTSASIPERVLAFMMDVEEELCKLGVPVKTRHNEVAPSQFELAPIFENANVAATTSMLTMEMLQNVARAPRPRLPAAREAVRGRQRLGQAQQLVAGDRHGREPARAGRDAARQPAVPVLLLGRHPRRRPAPGICCARRSRTPGNDHRLGANEAPPAIISIFLGDQLEDDLRARSRRGSGDAATPAGLPRARRVRAAAAAEHARRPQPHVPFAFTGNKFEFRAVGLVAVDRAARTRC